MNHQQAVVNTIRKMALAAGIKEGEKVLDAGCGRGGACFWLAEQLQAEPLGINISPNQLTECKNEAVKRNLSIEFIEADFCHTPFENNTFDVVWACESSCHSPQKLDFYKESFRILKPGGRVVIGDYILTSKDNKPQDEALLEGWLRNWFIDIDTEEEHRFNLKKSGFTGFNMSTYTKEVDRSVRNASTHYNSWGSIAKILSAVGLMSKVRFLSAYASHQQYLALQEGLWYYAIITANKPV